MSSFLKFILLSLCLLPGGFVQAQPPKIEWGKVSNEDLRMKEYDMDTSAVAIVLSDVGKLKFVIGQRGIRYAFERHRRVKILKRAGFEYADIAIPFYSKDIVKSLKAQIIQPTGKKNQLDKSAFFEEKVNEDVVVKKFAFPDVQEGSIVEYSYIQESERVGRLQDWYFQDDIPVRWSEYFLAIPEWYDYAVITQGRPPDITEALTGTETFTFEFLVHKNSHPETVQVTPKMSYYLVAMKDVPAMKMESFITTPDDYLARIRFQLRSVQTPRKALETYMSTWEELAAELMADKDFGLQFSQKNNYKKAWEEASGLLTGVASAEEKADRLYTFLARSMTQMDEYGIHCRNSLDKCFEQKKGSPSEINLLLLALLKEAGMQAYPLLVSTRSHGRMLDEYPFLDQFNHVMVMVELDKGPKIYDVGSISRPAGYPRINALNGMAWLLKPDKPEWLEVNPPAGNSTILLKGTLAENGALSAAIRCKYEGYDAIGHREELQAAAPKTYWQRIISQADPEAVVESLDMENAEANATPLAVQMACVFPSAASISGEFIYFAPVLLPEFRENPFKLDERTYPVEIPYPFSEQFILQLDVPKGYGIEELPESLHLSLPEKGGSFQYTVNATKDVVTVSYKLRIDQLVFEPDEYAGLKEFFDRIMSKQAEQVVLKRAG